MKRCINGRVHILHFILLFTHYPFISNGYNHRLVNEKSIWRTRRQEHKQNVGTVLFDSNDITKTCWSNDELTLLNSRQAFNKILPQANLIDGKNDKYIDTLMNYIDICVDVVKKFTAGKTKHLIMKALADTMGGYLRVYILPLTKSLYYAGNIYYEEAKRLFDLYEQLKFFLRTNGVGWLNPITPSHYIEALPIFMSHHNRSRRAPPSCFNLILHSVDKDSDESEDLVPIPYFDDNEKPTSIALPYENKRLYSLFGDDSAFILFKYYIDSVNCISTLSPKKNYLNKFRRHLRDWLRHVVKPCLNDDDDKWYPAFGGIMRVMVDLDAEVVEFGTDSFNRGYTMTPPHHEVPTSISSLPSIKWAQSQFDFIEIITIVIAFFVLIYLLIGICVNVCLSFSKERRRIEAYKKTPILEFYNKPKRFKYTRSVRSMQHQSKLPSDCTCSDESDDVEKYMNEIVYSTTVMSVRPKYSKSSSTPTVAWDSSYRQSYYTSDETSAFSSPLAKETLP